MDDRAPRLFRLILGSFLVAVWTVNVYVEMTSHNDLHPYTTPLFVHLVGLGAMGLLLGPDFGRSARRWLGNENGNGK